MSDRLVFAHANGFGASTYRVLLTHWQQAGYRVQAPERLGHAHTSPLNRTWSGLRDELADFIAQGGTEPVWLVGHSMGALLALMLACRRPDWVRGVVALDPPLLGGWRAVSMRLLQPGRLARRFSPGRIAERRRTEWPDRAAVRAHFSAKPLFAAWDSRVLDDYLNTGFVEVDDHIELAFRREVETRIFDTLPPHVHSLLKHHPPAAPVACLCSHHSVEAHLGGLPLLRKLAAERWAWSEGSHLFPMEQPDRTARQVLQWLAAMH